MYAFISNEFKTIVYTQHQLDFLCGVYSYPKFIRIRDESEALQFFKENSRDNISSSIHKLGHRTKVGYITIEYFIDGTNIYYNVHTEHFGYIKLLYIPSNVKIDSGYDLMKIKICNVILDDMNISHHCIAILNILKLFGDTINVELILPDISVFLACTKYTGTNFKIKQLQNNLDARKGEVYYTIKEL